MLPDSSAKDVMKALYDMNTDPYEMNNLLGNNPDSKKYDAKVMELEACFREWMAGNQQDLSKEYSNPNQEK